MSSSNKDPHLTSEGSNSQKQESIWKRYKRSLDLQGFLDWLQQGSWYFLWWTLILKAGNTITNQTKRIFGRDIPITKIEPGYGQGFFSDVGKVSLKTLNILLPIADALVFIGSLLAFYFKKNKNAGAISELSTTGISGALVIAASLTAGVTLGAWLMLSAIAVKVFETLVKTAMIAYQLGISKKRREQYIRPLIHNLLALTASGLTLTTLFYLTILITTVSAGAALTVFTAGSNLAVAAGILLLVTLSAKLIDELFIKPAEKIKEEKELELAHLEARQNHPHPTEESPLVEHKPQEENKEGLSWFHRKNRVNVVKKRYRMDELSKAKAYLKEEIAGKITALNAQLSESANKSHLLNSPLKALREKKVGFLEKVLAGLNEKTKDPETLKNEIKDWLKQEYKGAYQSTCRSIGDVEDITEAVMCYLRLEKKDQILDLFSQNTNVPKQDL